MCTSPVTSKICEKKFCPFCGEYQLAFKTFNSKKYSLEDYRVTKLPESWLSKIKEKIMGKKSENNYLDKVVFYNGDSYQTKSGEDIVNVNANDTIGYIKGIKEITDNTINRYDMGDNSNWDYTSIPKNCQIEYGTQPLTTIYTFICSKCGLETTEYPTKVVNFIGGKDSAKTTLIYKMLSYYSASWMGHSSSFDHQYWEVIRELGDRGKIDSTSIKKSPALSLRMGERKYSLFDVSGEEVDGIVDELPPNSIVVFTVALETKKNSPDELDTEKITEDLCKIRRYLGDIRANALNGISYFLAFTKSDNLDLGENKKLFDDNDYIQQLINTITMVAECEVLFVDPQPLNYERSKNLSKFVKKVFDVKLPQIK